MIRMKRTRPAVAGKKKMKNHLVEFFLTNDKGAKGSSLQINYTRNCYCDVMGIRSVGNYEKVLNESGNPLNANISNLLEVSCWNVRVGVGYKKVYYLQTKSGSILCYREDLGQFYAVLTNKGASQVFPVTGKMEDWIAVCSRTGLFLVSTDGIEYKRVTNHDTMGAGAFFKHRLFIGGKGGLVKYSAPEDYFNFTPSDDAGGEIVISNCSGELIAMKTHQDALYLFFQSGIVRLEIGGDPSKFYAEKLDYTGGEIFPRTICACQSGVYFLGSNGFYRLNGKKIEYLDALINIVPKYTGEEGCAVFKNWPVIRFRAGGVNQNVVITENGKSLFFLEGLSRLGGNEGELLFIDGKSEVSRMADCGTNAYEGVCALYKTNFGCAGKKRLDCLRFYGEGSFRLDMWWANCYFSRVFQFDNGIAEWKANALELSEDFQIELYLSINSRIWKVEAEFKTWE